MARNKKGYRIWWVIFTTIILGLILSACTNDEEVKESLLEPSPIVTSESTPEINSEESSRPQQTPIPLGVSRERVRVVKVVDGDTVKLEDGRVIRYIGIDTPETVHPSKPIQCYGKEASYKNRELVEGKEIELEKDVSEVDKYGRSLRYIWIGDIFVNEYLVREGFAQSSSYPPDVKYQDGFVEAQRLAREEGKGLWGSVCANWGESAPSQIPQPTSNIQLPVTDSDCSHDAYNCSNFSTHVQAQAVFEKCGGVNNDIHRLDADNDGLACESLP